MNKHQDWLTFEQGLDQISCIQYTTWALTDVLLKLLQVLLQKYD